VSKFLRKDEVWDLLPAVTVECVGKDLDSESYEELSDWLSYDICWEEIGEGAFENSPKWDSGPPRFGSENLSLSLSEPEFELPTRDCSGCWMLYVLYGLAWPVDIFGEDMLLPPALCAALRPNMDSLSAA
jgi:hypothetical protein